jgi:hypothetical protein
MRTIDRVFAAWKLRFPVRNDLVALGGLVMLPGIVHCGASGSTGGGCPTNDENGVSGGAEVVVLTVSDTAFAVGGVDSGSTESNITIENASTVKLTLTNLGTKPHDFMVQCMPTPNASGCPMQSCFPAEAGIPSLAPGESASTTFVAPFAEGPYPFVSDLPGDTNTSPDGGLTGLVGEFVLM